jgi:hypothetical protein
MLTPSEADEMSTARTTVNNVRTVRVPDPLPPAITRPRQLVKAVLAQSLHETGTQGRTALAWEWALTGTQPSPVTLTTAPGRPPTREQILAEAEAEPEGATARPGVPTDYCDQLREVRSVLAWLAGATDEIPVDDENPGQFIGAGDGYTRTDAEIRQVRDNARLGSEQSAFPNPMTPHDAALPWTWPAGWMDGAWCQGVRDLLDWVLGERAGSPLFGRAIGLPSRYDLTYEDAAADDVILQGRPAGLAVDPDAYPPPQYGEGLKEAIRWLRGETTTPPVNHQGRGAYGPTSPPW